MPGGWTFCARRLVPIAVALLLVPFALAARASTVSLPFDAFVELYVDVPRERVFVSGGSGTNAIVVFDFDGRLVRRIPNLPGAADMLVDGDRMYVALSNSHEIAVLDLASLERVDSIDVTPYAQPRYLSKSRDTIYFTYGCDPQLQVGSFGSVDLVTRVAMEHEPPIEDACAEHAVVPNDPNTMFVWDTLGGYGIDRYNVTARHPVFVDSLEERHFDQIGFSADGETFYTRRAELDMEGFGIEQRRISDFGLVREYPRGGSYALNPSESHLFAALDDLFQDDPDLYVYRTNDAAPTTKVDLDDEGDYVGQGRYQDVIPEAVGTTPAADRVFLVVEKGNYPYDFAFRVVWPQYPVAVGAGDQTSPAALGAVEVWSSSRPRARLSPLMARVGREAFRVSPDRTSGYGGGIERGSLVYQQVRGRQSDLRMYDLEKRRHTSALTRLNTRAWEWRPTMWHGRILFGRFQGSRSKVVLRTGNGTERVLANVPRRTATALPGQVNGGFAVWSVCARVCETYRLALGSGRRVKMPRPRDRVNYGASVTQAGIVYYVQSGNRCGQEPSIMRWWDGRVTEIEGLIRGEDILFTQVDDASGRVVFDHVECLRDRWDVLSFFDETNAVQIDAARRMRTSTAPGGRPRGRPWFLDELPGAPS